MSEDAQSQMKEPTVTEVPDQQQDQAVQAPSLGLQDLTLMANILEAVSQRGAIRPAEMETVGALYSKLVAFLVANGAIQPNQDTQEDKE